KITGEITFCDSDNISTDGIYPGKLTYSEDVSREEMAQASMMNYDPEFNSIAKDGDILVFGFNFGCGRSREQAATCLLYKGVPLVIAGSFGNIFLRNSINNALPGLEMPGLVKFLRERFSEPINAQPKEKSLTRRTGYTL